MKNAEIIRDAIIKGLSYEQNFKEMITAELNGNYFSAVDIALPNDDGKCQVYRISVVPHERELHIG